MTSSNHLIARIEFDNGVSMAVNEASLPMRIGRGTTTDICVPMSEVSRHHCELFMEDNVLYIRDSSTNGTRVGNTYLNKGSYVPIEGNTSVYLADETRLRVIPVDAAAPKAAAPVEQPVVDMDGDDDEYVEERSGNDRRQQDRRMLKRRRTNIVSVDFERRSRKPRRAMDRRIGDRRQ